jgi:16S rRNA C1402 N4-methylase RsmH
VSEGELIPQEDAIAAVDLLAGTVRQELDGLPARATRDVARQQALRLEVNASLARIAEGLRASARLIAEGGNISGHLWRHCG